MLKCRAPARSRSPAARVGFNSQNLEYRENLLMTAITRASIIVFLAGFTINAHAADSEKPWSSVQGDAAKRCARTFEEYQLQAVCMENEKTGYGKMQGSFGMPADVADQAKARCARTFDEFQLQAVCMENERKGYEKMKQYR